LIFVDFVETRKDNGHNGLEEKYLTWIFLKQYWLYLCRLFISKITLLQSLADVAKFQVSSFITFFNGSTSKSWNC